MLRKMRLELTRYEYHKILSLARLPIPTLPRTNVIIPKRWGLVNTFFNYLEGDFWFVISDF